MITPQGTKDLLFDECLAKREIEKNLSDLFKFRGYCEVITPGIEFYDVFNLTFHNIPQHSMYKLTDSKGRLIVLRPDLTIPIARLTATRLKNSPIPIRLYYNQSVYTANQSLNCTSDEIVQAGIELIGSSNKRADLEVITIATEVLKNCNAKDFRLEIGHIGLFNSLVKKLDVDETTIEDIRQLIEAKNYPSLNDMLDTFEDKKTANILKQLPRMFGGIEVLQKAEEIFDDEQTKETIAHLKDLYSSLCTLGLCDKITIDLGIVNRVDYYTGVVFRGYISGFGDEVLSGGRYDSLINEFGLDLPATGFAVNVDAIVKSMLSSKVIFERKKTDVMIFAEKGFEMQALIRQKQVIDGGETTEYCVFDDFDEAIEFAKQKDISFIEVVSEETKRVKI